MRHCCIPCGQKIKKSPSLFIYSYEQKLNNSYTAIQLLYHLIYMPFRVWTTISLMSPNWPANPASIMVGGWVAIPSKPGRTFFGGSYQHPVIMPLQSLNIGKVYKISLSLNPRRNSASLFWTDWVFILFREYGKTFDGGPFFLYQCVGWLFWRRLIFLLLEILTLLIILVLSSRWLRWR
jgi:hypothetical protein